MPNPRPESEVLITSLADQLIIGTMLGDGGIAVPCANPRLSITHRLEDLPYLEWKYGILKNCGLVEAPLHFPSYERSARLNSICTPALWKYRRMFYDGVGRKQVTKDIADSLTPLSLAVWYMDDGSFIPYDHKNSRITIFTLAFTEQEVSLLRQKIEDKFNVKFRVKSYRSGWILELSRQLEAFSFITTVTPYMHPCMARKYPALKQPSSHRSMSPEARGQFKIKMQKLWDNPEWRERTIKARHYENRRLPISFQAGRA